MTKKHTSKRPSKRPSSDLPFTITDSQNLTETEKEILYLLTNEYLTPEQISIRRQTTLRAVNHHIKKLREKGALNEAKNSTFPNTPPCHFKTSQKQLVFWRIHNLHFIIKPVSFSARYFNILKEVGNYGLNYRDWVIKFHKDMIELQSKALVDFRDGDKWKALSKVENSFNRTLRELSHKYGFVVWKEGKLNIKLVNQHIALTNGDVSHQVKDSHLLLKGLDGKVWFEVDNSNGMREYEYRHPSSATSDSENLEPYFNDLRYNKPPTLSEMASLIKEVVDLHKETAAGLKAIVDLLRPKDYNIQEKNPKEVDYIG